MTMPNYGECETKGSRVHHNEWGKPVGKYTGQWRDGKLQGVGKLEYENGEVYDGWWMKGQKMGIGKLIQDQQIYYGYWKNGQQHGKGAVFYPNGGKYIGQWDFNAKQGYGVMIYGDGRRYEGWWYDDKHDGHGVLYYVDDSVYKGCWKAGNKHGEAVFVDVQGQEHKERWDSTTGQDKAYRPEVELPLDASGQKPKLRTKRHARKGTTFGDAQKWRNSFFQENPKPSMPRHSLAHGMVASVAASRRRQDMFTSPGSDNAASTAGGLTAPTSPHAFFSKPLSPTTMFTPR